MSNQVKGIAPGFLLLPAREYSWELVNKVEIRIPNEGTLSALVEQSKLSTDVKFPGDDSYLLFDESDTFFSLWEVVRALFAAAKYPELQDNECLNVVGLAVEGENVVLYGEIIRSL